jgi:molybdopterin-guanine dinucleotide biosynthesis protein A
MIGIVLAGGQSRRFGTDKATYHLASLDASNVQLAVSKLLPFCEQVAVSVSQKNQQAISQQLQTFPRTILVEDQPPFNHHGPLSGLVAVTQHFSGAHDYLMVAVDYPFLRPETVQVLADHPQTVIATDGHLHYSLAHFRADYQTVHTWLAGNNWRLGAFLAECCRCHPLFFPPRQEFTNLNYINKKEQP